MGNFHPSHLFIHSNGPHMRTYTGHLSKFLNCVKPIFANHHVLICPVWQSRKTLSHFSFGMLVLWEKLNQRSHSCSVVPSVDKGWAVQCGRTVSMFSTDGCMPGPQFDNPVEGYGLCLKLGSQSKVEQEASYFSSMCVLVYVCVRMHVLIVLPTLLVTWTMKALSSWIVSH